MDVIKIIFLLARSRLNKAGKCSLRCRITYLQKRYEFATGLFINYPLGVIKLFAF
jgi:hypothetical protein